jgi:hypothetical protein
MELDKQIKLGHLLLNDRKCRVCGEIKNLVGEFYRTRKDRGPVSSSYSYECKECTIKRIKLSKNNKKYFIGWEYPDW